MNKPLVSIVMAVYNGEKFIHETIKSILNQGYENFELILIDDCSTDSTLKILQSYTEPRIQVIHNETNRKLAASLNRGIRHASGKYIARMDADDLCESNRFTLQVNYMEKHPDVDVLGGNYRAFGSARYKSDYPSKHKAIETGLFFENTVCHPAVMFRRQAISSWYDESFAASQDYDLWTRLIAEHNFHNLKAVVMKYRVHEGQTLKTASGAQKAGANSSRLRMLNKLNISETDKDKFIEFCNLPTELSFQKFLEYCRLLDDVRKNGRFLDKRAYKHYARKCIWKNVYNQAGKRAFNKIFKYSITHYGFYFLSDVRMAYLIIRRMMSC